MSFICYYFFLNSLYNHISGYKETAFVLSLSGAALLHVTSIACSSGMLAGCTCDVTNKADTEAWIWGGCADNVRYMCGRIPLLHNNTMILGILFQE